jgi:hypothetical protein
MVAMPETLKTPHDWITLLDTTEKIEFHKTARIQTRNCLYPQHRSLADDYYHRAFVYWWHSKRLFPRFKAKMVSRRARFFYLDDLRSDRLRVEDHETFINTFETSDPTGAQRHPLPDAILNNKKLVELIIKLCPHQYLPYLEKIAVEEPYLGNAEIDNARLAASLGVDVEEVRRALDCIRRKLKRHGLSKGLMI